MPAIMPHNVGKTKRELIARAEKLQKAAIAADAKANGANAELVATEKILRQNVEDAQRNLERSSTQAEDDKSTDLTLTFEMNVWIRKLKTAQRELSAFLGDTES